MGNYDRLINLFKRHEYGHVEKVPSQELILNRYHLFPNEAIYLVDYKTAEIETLTKNFDQISGLDSRQKHAGVLYDHVHERDMKLFLGHIERLLRFGFIDPVRKFQEEKDLVLVLYRTIKGRVILKSTAVLEYDSFNRVRYSIGKLMDVTDLVPYHGFSYKFVGPASNTMHAAFEGVNEFADLLTRRELEILVQVGKGYSSPQIAERLFVSRHTVDTHKRNIIRKLEASNSIDAFNKAVDLGIMR